MAAAPKLDLKTFVLPAMLLLGRNFDMKDEKTVSLLQTALISVAVVVLALHFYVYSQLNAKKNTKVIYVPPKAKASLPFGLGPPEEPVKPEDYEKTTYPEYEFKLLKESVGSVAMSVGISLVMSFKFNIHMSLMIQAVMTPLNLIDSPVMKKYLLGSLFGGDANTRYYNELDTAPTAEYLATLAAEKAAAEGTTETAATTTPAVEATPAADKKKEEDDGAKSPSGEEKEKPTKTTAANEVD